MFSCTNSFILVLHVPSLYFSLYYLQHSFLFHAQFYSDHSTHSIFTGHTTRSPGFSSTTTKMIPKWIMAKDQLHSEHKRYIHYTVFSFPFETTVDVWDLVCIHHFRRIWVHHSFYVCNKHLMDSNCLVLFCLWAFVCGPYMVMHRFDETRDKRIKMWMVSK